MKVMSIIGTRPEAIKMAPVIEELRRRPGVHSCVASTGQHRQMLDQVLEVFHIEPDYDLAIMSPDQSPTDVLTSIVRGLAPLLKEYEPDWLLVQGDTTSALAAALVGAYANCRVAHVEAGLRTYNRKNPFPEELNRVLIDHASDLLFAPTGKAAEALAREGIARERIHITGNTIVDALQAISARRSQYVSTWLPNDKHIVLVTTHRRENHGEPLQSILKAVREIAERPDVHVVFPVHRNPNVWHPVHDALSATSNITLIEPLDYLNFISLMSRAELILTDSGGIQEEAPSLGVQVLVMRTVTERSEAVEAGLAQLVGTESTRIVGEANKILDRLEEPRHAMIDKNPFGDGHAAKRIAGILCDNAN
jgi:UDP-N-acetylglucosamine 2-epimerase (non-hydrolysing)